MMVCNQAEIVDKWRRDGHTLFAIFSRILNRASKVHIPRAVSSLQTEYEKRVTATQFVTLLVSRRRLVRVDQSGLGLRGLRDVETGETFEVEERKLLEIHQLTAILPGAARRVNSNPRCS
jgi:hypothetical protein